MIYAPERNRSSDWTIAMVVPLQGPAGLFGPSCEAMSELVARDLNDAGGILGREVRMEVVDGGGDPARVAAEVGALVDQGRIDAVTGWHISSVRHTLAPVLAGRVPYVYPALYEGGEHRPGVYCSGETPRLQIEPALRWMCEHMGMRRWYVVGDDYVWPRRSAAAVHAFADEIGLDIVGQSFVSLGGRNIGRVVRHIAETKCDGVCMLLVGQDAVAFNRSFARAGLQDRLIRFTPLMDENMMIASGPGALMGMFAAASYFRSKADTNSMALLGRYVDLHGPDGPPITAVSESCYEGGQTLAHLIGRAGSPSVAAIDAALDGTAYEGPRGTVEFKGRRAHQPVHLAVADGLDFDVLTTL